MTSLICLLAAISGAEAQTYKTKAQMLAEIAAQLPSGTPGAITAAILRGVLNDMTQSYDQGAVLDAQTGTSYTFAADDNGQLVTFSNTAAIAVTLPQANTAGFNPWSVWACNINNGVVTITPTTSNIGGFTSVKLAKNGCYRIVSDGTNYQLSMIQQLGGSLVFTVSAINFNSANTDTSFNLALPPGYSNYLVSAVYVSACSASLSPATFGVFTAAAGGGTQIVATGTAGNITGTTSGSAASVQTPTVIGAATIWWALASVPTLFFRVQTAKGSAATCTVSMVITPVS